MGFEVLYSVTSLLCTFAFALFVTTIIFKWFRERNYPPGPIGIPVFGYALFIGKNPSEKFISLKLKYGDVFSFYLGSHLTIIIHDFHVAKEVLCNPKLLQRPNALTDYMMGKGGFGGMSGEQWVEQRRFSVYTMRNLGMGKGLWETMIQEAFRDLIEDLKSYKGQPVNLEKKLGFFIARNLVSLLLGRHLDKVKDAENLKIIEESVREFMKQLGRMSVHLIFPWMRTLLKNFKVFGFTKFYDVLSKFNGIFKKEVEARLKSPESLERDDYIGCFYREMKKRESETKDHTFTIENLLGNLFLLFIASTDSSVSSILFMLLYMAEYPDIQKRVHDEIDSVAGREGVIYYKDRTKFPYTMAAIFEMLRHVTITPLITPRLVLEDMTINNYKVPKDSYIVVNNRSLSHDPRYFKDPVEYNPERFLGENGKVVKDMDGFIPFSVGKRNCPGEGVAIMTLFLYFTSFMQKFKVTAPQGKKVDLEPVFGGAYIVKPQELCFLER